MPCQARLSLSRPARLFPAMLKRAIDYVLSHYGETPNEEQLHAAACIYSTSHFEYALIFIGLKQYFQ